MYSFEFRASSDIFSEGDLRHQLRQIFENPQTYTKTTPTLNLTLTEVMQDLNSYSNGNNLFGVNSPYMNLYDFFANGDINYIN